MYRLVFLSGRYQGKRLVVRQAVTLVGREPACHLLLPDDDLLAPQHARLEERGKGVFLVRLSPDHPVERNGEPVLDSTGLVHDDLLTIGRTLIRFENIIAPHRRFRPSPGLLQPATWLLTGAILLIELGLLMFLVDWPGHLIRPETEAEDLARAEEIRAVLQAQQNAETGGVAKVAAPASVVELPGTQTVPPPESVATNLAESPPAAASATTSPAPAAILQVLDEADFSPADTNTLVAALPPVSAADPRIEEAQRQLAEAVSAAQFADYARAFRILNQLHQTEPGFLPAHVEHARLLEVRGDLDAAQQRWSQILGLAPEHSAYRARAAKERERLATLRNLQTQILRTAEVPDLSALPRHIRALEPDIQKMPADSDIAEMRVLKATLELSLGERLFKDASVRVFVTFYDIDADSQIRPTRAITSPSPVALGNAFADRRSLALEATYVVPRGLRAQEERETGRSFSYYGYTIHVFAGQILQDAIAKPKKLLDLPIYFPETTLPEP